MGKGRPPSLGKTQVGVQHPRVGSLTPNTHTNARNGATLLLLASCSLLSFDGQKGAAPADSCICPTPHRSIGILI